MNRMVLMRRAIVVPTLLSSLLVALAACSSSPESSASSPQPPVPGADAVSVDQVEIVRGVPDRGRDPAVVAIDVGEEGLCSGALIAANVVLTARHCVARTTEQINCPASLPQVGAERSASSLQILVGDEVGLGRVVARGKEILAPKGWSLCDADIALIVLDQPVAGIAPLALRQTGVAVGDHIRSVGYGRSVDGGPAGVKLLRDHVRVLRSTASEFIVGEATCQGDSGGPAIDEETGQIVGVVSRGGPTCDGSDVHNIYTRTDVFLSLIEEAFRHAGATEKGTDGHDDGELDGGTVSPSPNDAGHAKKEAGAAKPKKPASDMGGACHAAADCAAGVCVSEHGKQYCSRPCGTHDRCPAHFACKMATSGSKVCVEN